MAYSQFTLSDIKSKFHGEVELATGVFAVVPPQDLSSFLAETLQEHVPLALAVSPEKARSACIPSLRPNKPLRLQPPPSSAACPDRAKSH